MIKLVLLLALMRNVNSDICWDWDLQGNRIHCALYCPAGYYGVDSTYSCTQCQKGTFQKFRKANDWDCDNCPADTYASADGSTVCTACAQSACDPKTGAPLACLLASGSTYPRVSDFCAADNSGIPNFAGHRCGVAFAGSNNYCTAGRYFKIFPDHVGCNYLNENLAFYKCGQGCMVCPAGEFQPYSSLDDRSCDKCPVGTYSPYLGSKGCQTCNAGYICPLEGMTYPCDCLKGTYSASGATACLTCTSDPDNGYITGNGVSATSCAFKCNAGFYKTNTPSCAVCGFGRFSTIALPDGSICNTCLYASITGAACATGSYPSFSSTTCAVTKCTACSNLPASGNYYSTTSDQNYYSTAAITTAVSLTI